VRIMDNDFCYPATPHPVLGDGEADDEVECFLSTPEKPTLSEEDTRALQWMGISETAGCGESHVDECYSDTLPDPKRAIIIGTNGTWGCALVCPDAGKLSDADEKSVPDDAPSHERLFAKYEAYARVNDAFAYKLYQSSVERRALVRYAKDAIDRCVSQEQADLLRSEFEIMRGADPLIAERMEAAERALEKKRKGLPAANCDVEKHVMHTANMDTPRPGGGYPKAVRYPIADAPRGAEHERNNKRDVVTYTLATCHGGGGSSDKVKWHESHVTLRCLKGTVPVASMNDTHIAIVYCRASQALDMFHLCVNQWELPAQGGRPKLCRDRNQWLMLPHSELMGRTGRIQLHVHLASDGRVAFGFGGVVGVVGGEAFRIDSPDRIITCVRLDDTAVCAGTTTGEAFRFTLGTGNDVHHISHVMAVEPIMDLQWVPAMGVFLMQTIMSTFLDAVDDNVRMQLQGARITASAVHDKLMCVLSKYGFVQMRTLHVRELWRRFDPPKDGAQTPHLQPSYRGVHMSDTRVVVIYPSGLMRTLTLKQGAAN